MGKFAKAFPVNLHEGHKQVFPCQQQAVALILKAVHALERPLCPCEPFFFGVRVFTHNTQLAVQQANSLGNGNGFARYGIVAAYQIGSLAAGDFQPLCIHIFLPCVLTVVRESDFVSRCFPRHLLLDVENILSAKPLLIHQIVLCVADPTGGKHLCFITGAVGLMLHCFFHSGLDQTVLFACNQLRQDFFFEAVWFAQFGVIIGCPDDVFLGGFVLKQNLKEGAFMVQKFLLQQVNPCNAEHPPPSLPFIDGTIITHLSGFVNVYHPPFSSGHPIFQCPAGKNPKSGGTLVGTRLCLQSLVCYTLVPADAEKGLREVPASTCSVAEGCADGHGS